MTQPKLTDPRRAHQEVEPPTLKETLVRAAEQVLAEHGPEGTTILRIATRAGVSLGTLLRCFRDKDAIVAEAMARRERAKAQPAPPPPAASAPRARVPAPPPTSRPIPAPPPASALFRRPEPPREPVAAPAPAIPRPPEVKPQAPRETLEEAITILMRELVSTFAQLLPAMASMPTSEKEAINRAELKRLAKNSEALLARHQVPSPAQVAYVMTHSCDKVIKDAMRNASESFSDGRLERALCRLCLDFVRSG